MGLGAVAATFGALGSRYLRAHGPAAPRGPERFVVMVGDAELDEGNVWEALGEERPGRTRQRAVDRRRQPPESGSHRARRRSASAPGAVPGVRLADDRAALRPPTAGTLRAARGRAAARAGSTRCPTPSTRACCACRPGAIRKALAAADGGSDGAIEPLLAPIDDAELAGLIGDVGGHDLAAILDAFAEAEATRRQPCAILAHTIKGWGLPIAGDPLNHTALLSQAQIEALRDALGVTPGDEWAGFPPESPEARLIAALPAPFTRARAPPPPSRCRITSTRRIPRRARRRRRSVACSARLSRLPVADAIVTVSADVAVTTHLAGWINRRGVFRADGRARLLRRAAQAVRWAEGPRGPASRAGHRRAQPVSPARRARARPRARGRDAASDRHTLRPVRHPRSRRALPRALRLRALRRRRARRRA